MNKPIFYLSLILIVGIFFIRCSKSNKISEPEPEPEPPRKDKKYKVIEYHTNEPIHHAVLEWKYCEKQTGYCFPCGCASINLVGSWYSDSNGEISIPSHWRVAVNMIEFRKENYWTKNSVDSTITGQKLDSAVVRLFPYSWLKIHMKHGTTRIANLKLTMTFAPILDSTRTYHTSYGYFSYAANNLDTTVIYKTFGNIKNIVKTSLQNGGNIQEVFSKTEFVKKNDTVNVEILL